MTECVTEVEESTDIKIIEPKKYKVILFNDNHTTVEFVIALLLTIFRHSESSAYEITMKVHNEGKGVAGVYTHEVAEQKSIDCIESARKQGFPLVVKVEVE